LVWFVGGLVVDWLLHWFGRLVGWLVWLVC
jgi:hypothetical protein